MKRDNFYRRDPGQALSGMVGLSLEERGVYNTIIDMLYLTWRPLEDSRAYIANFCGCAVQKLNPIIERLVAKGKLLRFEENGAWFLSNDRFEDERAEVKGAPKSRSGRGGVGEKSEGVREKSTGVEENTPTCANEVEQNQQVTPLEKRREDKTRDMSAAADLSDLAERVWSLASQPSRKRSGRKDVENALKAFLRRKHDPERLLAALKAYFASDQATKDGGQFAKGVHRLIEGDRWTVFEESAVSDAVRAWDRDTWALAIRKWREDPTQWGSKMGPPPGKPGCIAPPDLLIGAAA